MKILPSEPTRAMLNAGWIEADRRIEDGKDEGMIAIYRAMSAAYTFDEAAAVERVARAIAKERGELDRFTELLERGGGWQYIYDARAAIRALMEGE